MANTLYSAYMAAGSSSGKYKASLYETSNWADKFDFIGKQTAWEEEKTSRRVSAIGDTLELASTAYGGYQDKEKTLSQAKSLEGKYGSLQEDRRSHGERGFDWLMGKEQTYTFGEGESATTLSKEAVKVQGAIAMGESMLAEYQDKFYGKDIKKEIEKEIPTLSLGRQGVLFGDSLAKGLSNIKSDDNTDSSFSNSENIDSFSPYGINSREELF
tara:strand:- start:21 stop:662 length:642 start_codon:yes stop_codon:yes gene_type:complete